MHFDKDRGKCLNLPRTIAAVIVTKDFGESFERTMSSLERALPYLAHVYIVSPDSEWKNPNSLPTNDLVFLKDSGAGVYEAMNLMLLQEDLEDYILFLNAGDELLSPTYINECKSLLKVYEDTVAIVSGYETRLAKPHGKLVSFFLGERKVDASVDPKKIKQCSFLIKTEVFKEIGGFNLEYKIASDYDLIIKVLSYNRTRIVDINSSIFYLDGISSLNRVKSLKEQRLVESRSTMLSPSRRLGKYIYFQLKMLRAKIIDLCQSV
jgi:hypothetical protein